MLGVYELVLRPGLWLHGTRVCWQELYLRPRFGRRAARLCQGFFILLLGRAPKTTLVYKHTACRDRGVGIDSGPERRRWPFLPRWCMLTSIKLHANIRLEDFAYAKKQYCLEWMCIRQEVMLLDSCLTTAIKLKRLVCVKQKTKIVRLHESGVEGVTFLAVSCSRFNDWHWHRAVSQFKDSHTRWRQHFPFGGINPSAIITLPLTRLPGEGVPSVNELRAGPLHWELSTVTRSVEDFITFALWYFATHCLASVLNLWPFGHFQAVK